MGIDQANGRRVKKWMVVAKKADFAAIAEKYRISQILARIIRNRDIIEESDIDAFLNGTVADFHDPSRMLHLPLAAGLLIRALDEKRHIRVIGDYDVDGICSTFILYRGLTELGGEVSWQLPDRVKDGYGINRKMIDRAVADNVALILTCDNGISAYDEILYAKEQGLTVVVTDHHEAPAILPPADAVVDPKQPGCSYPWKEICGAFVAYQLIRQIYHEKQSEMPEELLGFAAFATECDVMPLLNENRILMKYGLKNLSQTTNLGFRTLMEATGCDQGVLTPCQLGFVIGPCVNATGRLESPARALQLFLSEDSREAATIAGELKALNETRKARTEEYTKTAIRVVTEGDANNPVLDSDNVLLVYLPDCHESLAGIVAGRVRERFYKPTLIVTDGEEHAKGSARSIEGYSMVEALTSCRRLLLKFGGHKMAAGFSVAKENIDLLREQLNREANLSEEVLTEKLLIDIAVPTAYWNMELVEELDLLGPYGQGNPRPVFAEKDLLIREIRVLGKHRNFVKIFFQNTDYAAVIFTDGDEFETKYAPGQSIALAYTPEINEYMGRRQIQLRVVDLAP